MQFQPIFKLTVCKVGGSKIIKMGMKSMSHTGDVIINHFFKANSKFIEIYQINII